MASKVTSKHCRQKSHGLFDLTVHMTLGLYFTHLEIEKVFRIREEGAVPVDIGLSLLNALHLQFATIDNNSLIQ